MKPMHPTKFLGCNSWTLPFPIPAGGQGPAGLQSARSRAGPAGQSSGFWPLDLQRTLGCLGKPRGSDLSAKGWSGQGLEPKGEAFLRPPGCANRGRTTWFPAPRSPSSLTCGPHPSAAPTGCRPLGTQERTQWAFPAATATPERTTGKPSPTPASGHWCLGHVTDAHLYVGFCSPTMHRAILASLLRHSLVFLL